MLETAAATTVVLQVKWRQGGAGESGRQPVAPGLAEIVSDPVKEQGVGVPGARWLVEVNDAATEDDEAQNSRQLGFIQGEYFYILVNKSLFFWYNCLHGEEGVNTHTLLQCLVWFKPANSGTQLLT